MGSIYRLTLHQLSGRWRLLIMTVLAAMPVAITALMLASSTAPRMTEFEGAILSALLAGAIAPLVVLAIAAAAFGNEVEDRTLGNLALAPISRWRIAVPKLLGTLTIAGVFVATSAFATAHIGFIADPRATIAVTVSAIAGVAMYGSLFVWLGLVSTKAIGIGLLYIVLWEGLFSGFVSGVRLLSVRHYALAIMHGLDPRRFAAIDFPSLAVAATVAVVVVGGFLFLTVQRLRRMDVP